MSQTAGELWYAAAEWRGLQRDEYPYQYAEDVLIRYVDVEDARDLESIVAYVSALADTSSLYVNGQPVAGTWRTTHAGYRPVNPDEPLGATRILHTLVNAALTSSDGPYVVENNCTYKVSDTFYWRQAALATVPAGSSGITYSITSKTRDPLTGLWNFVIEKREQITTYVASHKIAESQFATVYEQKLLGVRTGDVDDTGASLSGKLWTVGTTVQGTSVTESREKNENCTQNITQTKTVAKSAEAVVERTRTAFGDVVSVTLRNQTAAVNDYVDVAGGIVFTRSSRENDDGTFDNTETQRIATESGASVEMTKNAFVARASTTVRNQASAVAGYVDVSGGIITIQSWKKNDDGTFDNTETLLTAIEAQNATVERTQSVFEISVSITHRNQTDAVNALVVVANGVITRRSSRLNDDKTYDNTESLSTVVAVSDVTVERYRTMFEEGVTITNLNQATAVNAFVDVSGGIITRRSSRLNEHGRYDNTESTTTAIEALNASVEKYKTAFEIGVTITNRNQTAAVSDLVEVSGGVITRRRAVLNADGRYDNTETLTTKRPDVQRAKRTTVQGLETVADTDTQQVTTVPADVTSQTAGTAVTRVKTANEAGGTDVREIIETGAKWSQTWTVPDARGDYTVLDFANWTLDEITAQLATLGVTDNSFQSPGQPNKFGKYDGRIMARPVSGGSATYAYTTGPSTEYLKKIRYDRDRVIKEVYTLTVYTARGYGCSLGFGNYMAKNPDVNFGSSFQDVGSNWFYWKAVTAVTLVATDITTAYYAGSTITL